MSRGIRNAVVVTLLGNAPALTTYNNIHNHTHAMTKCMSNHSVGVVPNKVTSVIVHA
jgi:hypothetical protein